ncbi:hypothetical protein TIFTF001_018491 [Ficus carica]|uniref:Uncharacterized protein n=1 Tax=Ficus carica TaxID=3494 RepID=A0AA88AVK7_FICCA|nr:hypothetical protein TIFTF001_018491 [Ficus carica]
MCGMYCGIAIWTVRNQWIHDEPKVSAIETLEKVSCFLGNYQACCMAEYDPAVVPHKRNKQWIRPPEGKMKLNTDASVRSGTGFISVRPVIRRVSHLPRIVGFVSRLLRLMRHELSKRLIVEIRLQKEEL